MATESFDQKIETREEIKLYYHRGHHRTNEFNSSEAGD